MLRCLWRGEFTAAARRFHLIIAHAKNKGMDMIIMGHQGKKGLSQYLVGSVATKIVRHAPCSVLIVR